MLEDYPIRTATLQDISVIYEFLRRQNKEAYMIRNERAWRIMAKMLCKNYKSQLSTVYQMNGKVVGYCSVITDPGKFWKTFIRRYGVIRFHWKKLQQAIEIQKEKNKDVAPVIEGYPVDENFLARAKKRYESVPGKVYIYYLYAVPEEETTKVAFALLRDMEDQLTDLGFKTLESEILAENMVSKKICLAFGYDVRSIGDMWYAVKQL